MSRSHVSQRRHIETRPDGLVGERLADVSPREAERMPPGYAEVALEHGSFAFAEGLSHPVVPSLVPRWLLTPAESAATRLHPVPPRAVAVIACAQGSHVLLDEDGQTWFWDATGQGDRCFTALEPSLAELLAALQPGSSSSP